MQEAARARHRCVLTLRRYRTWRDDSIGGPLLAAATLAACLLLPACERGTEPEEPTNVLLISIDSLRADHVGAYGYPLATTPTIDRLAKEGVVFANALSTTSWTLPAHAALLTGVHDRRHGATVPTATLDRSISTLAEAFSGAGYRTVGFYSGPFLHPRFGLERGFDEYVDCTSYHLEGSDAPASPRVHASSHKDITNPRIAANFAAALDGADGRPFFFFVHMWDVHYELVPPPPYDRMFGDGSGVSPRASDFRHDPAFKPGMDEAAYRHVISLYDGEIRFTDDTIARLLAELERRGSLAETLVVVTSDHGEEFLEHEGKGHRQTLFQEVLRVPLVFWAPGLLPPGRADATASLVDVAPTVAALAGIPPLRDVDGQALFDEAGRADARPRIAIAELRSNPRRPRLLAAVSHPHKVIREIKSGRDDYYDLRRDPAEKSPLDARIVPAAGPLRVALDERYGREATEPSPGTDAVEPMPPAMERRLRELGYLD